MRAAFPARRVPPFPLSPVPFAKKAFLCLYWFLVATYLAAALAVLGLRYLVLPRVDDFRPRIEAAAGDALGAPVSIARVQADWRGLHPRLRLAGVTVAGRQGEPVLSVPAAAAVLSWRSVLLLKPRLLSLEVAGLDLTVRRAADGRLWVAGQAFEPGGDDAMPTLDHPALQWLLAQRELVVRDATVRWRDELRGAPELVLDQAEILLRNRLLQHVFALSARPQGGVAAGLALRGELHRRLLALDGGRASAWNGQAYAQLDDAEPAAWQPWLDMPAVQGRVAARVWLDLARGRPAEALADVALRDAGWRQPGPEGMGAQAATLTARLQGEPQELLAALQRARQPAGDSPAGSSAASPAAQSSVAAAAPSASSPGATLPRFGQGSRGLAVQLRAGGVALDLPGVFVDPVLRLDDAQADFTFDRAADGLPVLMVRRLAAANADLSASVQGVWRGEADGPGSVDMQGSIERAAMPALYRYMPGVVHDNVRRWLREGLLAGRAAASSVLLRGPLRDFPYAADSSSGQFRIEGSYADATVDYAPARDDRPGWPRLTGLSGTFEIERSALRLRAQAGQAATGPDQAVDLEQVQAEIPDMEHQATLRVQGRTQGEAPAYLAMMNHSPLGRLLDHALDQASGTGRWQVPLALTVPLYAASQTEVSGSVAFDGADFALRPGVPPLQRLRGTLDFSERGVAMDGLQGEFLGGPLRASGELRRGAQGLRLAGSVPAEGLRRLSDAPVLQRLGGSADYTGLVSWRAPSVLDLSLSSTLQGLSVDLPAPLGKPAAAERALHVQWGPAREDGGARRWLTAELDGGVALQLEADPDGRGASVFRRGVAAVGVPPSMPERGLRLAGTLPEFDLPAWQEAVAQLDEPAPTPAAAGGAAARRPLFPPLSDVALDSARMHTKVMDLDGVSLRAERSSVGSWQASLAARQAAGAVQWIPGQAGAPDRMSARFDHLSLGEPDEQAGDAAAEASGAADAAAGDGDADDDGLAIADDDLADIPDLDLAVARFSLYGRSLGELQLSGRNVQRGQRWQLQSLRLSNESAQLEASGNWQLAGPGRGLDMDASMEVSDLGGLMAHLGLPDRVSGGRGKVAGTLAWRDLPWRHRYADLGGALDVSLDRGRFVHVNSRSARLLELLSLQSVQRLARLDFQPGSLLRDGFPFDTIRSRLVLGDGLARTDGVTVNSPVATIVLAGDTNLSAETWNLEAAVVPKLDASGAAIAAGIAVNPLIGLGAFLTQWVLKEPLARALTAQYTVRGTWDEPRLEPAENLPEKYGRREPAEQVEP